MTPQRFSSALLDWYDRNGRKDLPWQVEPTPYRVWVSEIMLQQTQVATVIPYYRRFMQRFPDIAALAAADQDQVLHHWSGLGYYARARNLHAAAQQLVTNSGGVFPDTLEAVMALPGVGRSTAGAILALACAQRHPLLDGNVKRVLARFHAVDGWPGLGAVQKQLWALAELYTPQARVAHYTQAIMDLGATLCTRGRPDCTQCPVCAGCAACRSGRQADYPAPRPARTLPVRPVIMLLLGNQDNELLLERRPPSGIWGGLWSFPELVAETDIGRWCEQQLGLPATRIEQWPVLRHTFSHFHLDITPVLAQLGVSAGRVMDDGLRVWYKPGQADERGLAAPVGKLVAQYLNRQHERAGNGKNRAMRKTG
ncbi:MAG TPA: A/G-specific adenine glycosylase [Gammaproteobacteria bacterium]|nr:A/G-specific adenine glycosylase [Gammaproteobacteria bacterium]